MGFNAHFSLPYHFLFRFFLEEKAPFIYLFIYVMFCSLFFQAHGMLIRIVTLMKKRSANSVTLPHIPDNTGPIASQTTLCDDH